MNKTISVIFGLLIFTVISVSLTENLILNDAFAVEFDYPAYACDVFSDGSGNNEIKTITKGAKHNQPFNDGFNQTISNRQQMIISGTTETINGCGGLAQDPTTGIWYISVREQGNFGGNDGTSYLATIDPTTGIGTAIGDSGQNINQMAFDNTGQLYAMAGFGDTNSGAISDQLQAWDKTTGQLTSVCTFTGDSPFGAILAFNWDTNKMWRIIGTTQTFFDGVEEIDLETCVASNGSPYTNASNYDVGSLGSHKNGGSYNTIEGKMYFTTKQNGNIDLWTIAIDGIYNAVSYWAGLTCSGFVGECQPPPSTTGMEISISEDIQDPSISWNGFAFSLVVSDAVAPVISAIDSEPISIIQDSSFDAFEFVQCVDDVDGAIVPNGDFWYVGDLVDTSTRGSQTVDYTCTDSADNNTLETIQYLVKKKSSSGGGSSSSTSSGTSSQSSIPQLSDIPTLSFKDSPSQQTPTPARTGQSIGDLFASLFADRLNPTENIPQSQSVFNSGQSSDSPSSDRSSPIADFFRNLFANIFG